MKLTSQLAFRSGRAGRRLRRRLGDFIADRRGFSAMTFAISAIPMFGLMGLAIDVGTAYQKKAQLQHAADIVATQLARRSMNFTSLDAEALVNSGKLMMSDNLEFPVSYEKFDVKLTDRDIEISADAQFDTNFAKLVGVSNLDISVTAKAHYEWGEVDIFVLVDNTASMLLGATYAESVKMRAEVGCEFACHTADGTDSYYKALNQGYKLRFSAVADAIGALGSRIKSIDPNQVTHRVGLYSFNEVSPNTTWQTELPLSYDMDVVSSAGSGMKPIKVASRAAARRHTDFVSVLDRMREEMRARRVSGRKQILLIITDGLHDQQGLRPPGPVSVLWTGWMAPISELHCSRIKSDGVDVAILETPYSSPSYESHGWYKLLVPKLGPALQTCASPGLYGAVDFSDINSYSDEMDRLVQKAASQAPRLVRNNSAGIDND